MGEFYFLKIVQIVPNRAKYLIIRLKLRALSISVAYFRYRLSYINLYGRQISSDTKF